ncbi:MAG TPA: helix-turn-helix domain-containing protein [Thermoleophilaceae bacterium]|nr:helix-turn-helix domain-containing protein [Thermoleophilaceae bacterium]
MPPRIADDLGRRVATGRPDPFHGENGIFGTSWQDIAKEADVSVATVYADFPSLDELLPACGALVIPDVKARCRFLRPEKGGEKAPAVTFEAWTSNG